MTHLTGPFGSETPSTRLTFVPPAAAQTKLATAEENLALLRRRLSMREEEMLGMQEELRMLVSLNPAE